MLNVLVIVLIVLLFPNPLSRNNYFPLFIVKTGAQQIHITCTIYT